MWVCVQTCSNIFIQLVPKGRFQLLFEAFKVWSHYHAAPLHEPETSFTVTSRGRQKFLYSIAIHGKIDRIEAGLTPFFQEKVRKNTSSRKL